MDGSRRARGGDLQGALDRLLAAHLVQVRQDRRDDGPVPRRGGRDGRLAREVGDELGDVGHGEDGQPRGDRRLDGAGGGDVEPLDPGLARGEGHGEHPDDGPQLAGEGQLAHEGGGGVVEAELAAGGEDPDEDGQVVDGAGLAAVGGREVDGHPADGEAEPAVLRGGADALTGLLDGGVRQPDDLIGGQAAVHVALGGDLVPGDALEPQGADRLQHRETSSRARRSIFSIMPQKPPRHKGAGGFFPPRRPSLQGPPTVV